MAENYPFIALKVKKPLQKEEIKNWYRICKTFLPSGIISTQQYQDLENSNSPVLLIKDFKKGFYFYKIPLTRDLLDEEIEPILENYSDSIDEDFSYEIVATTLFDAVEEDLVKDLPIDKIAKNIARYIHERDMKEMLENGWTYGLQDNYKMKISSELLPFEDLPKEKQDVDKKLIERIIKEFNDEGYMLIKKSVYSNLEIE